MIGSRAVLRAILHVSGNYEVIVSRTLCHAWSPRPVKICGFVVANSSHDVVFYFKYLLNVDFGVNIFSEALIFKT